MFTYSLSKLSYGVTVNIHVEINQDRKNIRRACVVV